MPTISSFYGILIRMFYNDHAPPRFHARYGELEAMIDLATIEAIEGDLSSRDLSLVQDWAKMHREELFEDWRLYRENIRRRRLRLCPSRGRLYVLGRR
jgi:hypothetical protein